MSKPLPRNSGRRGVLAFMFAITLAALVVLAGWVWQHRRHAHRAPAPAVYAEPGWMPANKSDRWKCIVIHHSAGEVGGAVSFDLAHRKRGWEGLGYHFVIGNGSETGDGQVEIGFRWNLQKQGAHCKTDDHFYNDHGIGICLVGNFDNHEPSQQQMDSLARLVRFLCREFDIPPSHIYTHGGVTGKTACPGKLFDLAAFKRALGIDEQLPQAGS